MPAILSGKATYEIQFGAIERPTHWNTSYDKARFAVCSHKWVDLSEGLYSVNLLNDCKYGYDIHHNRMRLTLDLSNIATDSSPQHHNSVRVDTPKTPDISPVPEWDCKGFSELIHRIRKAHRNRKEIILSMGAHVIKCGLSR